METSIIIRTKNEEKWVGKVLEKLQAQTYRDFEIIVVDSGSTDRTLEIVKEFPVRLFQIKPEDFSYPYALNFGCRQAKGEKYFVFLSAHSLPISDTWLKDGISDFENEDIAGIYGDVVALSDATIWEKLFFNKIINKLRQTFRRKIVMKKSGIGVLGFTNAIIRRNLWEERSLNEKYGAGGEDMEWADYWLKKNYKIINDAKFSVFHSHGLGIAGLAKQMKHWLALKKPGDFKQSNYRSNG